ncbi:MULTISPECIES: putative quinol monooxygenase [unclassified Neisseria]|uniref:putative quinol monooxygenase n=1 Tax=unclassified Neisseria TaxID=2623750 RepID=UPI0026656DB4|nr:MULTISPECIES: putative quinol monooxygenase [unclassified Neisseria]MDO1509421.1 putative quinol monooxygenase [Neisseria sp. MVDL19-042950]MDO1515806.1 putative quinol monooxygenase [Neisseria sp. MVDL18-041461]MDO1563370.1 putative quinol monooxygenase [Neisseria sp. MVDL20-010259]
MQPVKIVAAIVIKPEYSQELFDVFQRLVLASRQEAGNLRYDLHQDIENPDRVVFFEIWRSQAAVDAHAATVHFQDFLKAIEGKTESLEIIQMHDISDNSSQ